MTLDILDPKELTIEQALEIGHELWFIYLQDTKFGPVPTFITFNTQHFDKLPEDKLLLRLQPDEIKEKEEPKKMTRTRRTYKLDSTDPNGIVEVESRITGEIRVNFNDKESAELYRKHIAKLFYKRTTGADFLTTSTIYKELKVVNWEPSDCDPWGYPTMDSGTLRYISEVAKTKGRNKYGFTLSAPQKIEFLGS